jgi:hypothetical protein
MRFDRNAKHALIGHRLLEQHRHRDINNTVLLSQSVGLGPPARTVRPNQHYPRRNGRMRSSRSTHIINDLIKDIPFRLVDVYYFKTSLKAALNAVNVPVVDDQAVDYILLCVVVGNNQPLLDCVVTRPVKCCVVDFYI